MPDGSNDHETPTRQDTIKYGEAVIGGGLFAGYIGQSNFASPLTGTTVNDSSTAARTTRPEMESYSVAMTPVDTIKLDEVPKSVSTVLVHHVDAVVALGHGDTLNAIYSPSNPEGNYDKLLGRLDGVLVDWSNLYNSWNPGKETLYELDSNLRLANPAYVSTMSAWDIADIEEVQTEIAPRFENSFSRNHSKPPVDWADRYQYYSLRDILGRVAQVSRERGRYETLSGVKTTLNSTVSSSLPAGDNRP